MSIIQSVISANLENIREYLPESVKMKDSFAFLIFAMTSVLDITINEAIPCVTDGFGDGGIDAIYIDETEDNIVIHFFQTKYRTALSKGIGKNEIDLTIAKIEEIFQGSDVENQSKIMKERIDEIRNIIKEKGQLKMPESHVHFVVNTHKPNESDSERAKLLEEKGNYFVFFYGGEDILQLIDKSKQKDCKIGITTYKDILHLGADKKLGDVKGIVTTVSAAALVKIYDIAGRDKALSRNIRYFLGDNRINRKIRETADSLTDSKYFWFLNNGVTIVCDKFSFTDDSLGNKIIQISNPKIINGGQTTKSLYHLHNDLKSSPGKTLEDVYLLLRLYETENEELIDKITEGTNSQNPIFARDLKANHPVQLLVKKYFLQKGFYYETHRREYDDQKIKKDNIAGNERVFQSYISLFRNMPHEAKSSKSKIFERYFDEVFKLEDKELPRQLLISFKLLRFIEEQAKMHYGKLGNGDLFLNHAEFALIYIAGKIYENIKTDIEISNNVTLLKNLYAIEVSILRIMIDCEKRKDFDYSHNKFFKSRDFTVVIEKLLNEEIIALVGKFLSLKQDRLDANTTDIKQELSLRANMLYFPTSPTPQP
jgi:hypothetical protein